MNPDRASSNRSLHLGIALLCGASLLFELVLTRLFSVILWYHFALAVISLALLGIGAGGVWLYVFQRRHPPERMRGQLALCSLGFGLSAPFGTALMVRLSPAMEVTPLAIVQMAVIFLAAALPFFFVGLAVSLALTHRTKIAGRIYAADLTGAGIGCAAVVKLLGVFDLGGAVLVIGLLGLAAALVFSLRAVSRAKIIRYTAIAAVVLAILLAGQIRRPWLTVRVSKGQEEENREWEQWNAFSRIAIFPSPLAGSGIPAGWGMSPQWHGRAPEEKWIFIDGAAMTPITQWDGTQASLDRITHLDWDVTALGHHLRRGGDCLIVGSGGGRDLLTALRFGQTHIQGVEINTSIVDAMRGRYAAYSGHVYDNERVDAVADEARSWLERSDDDFDLLQISMIDTWAATAAGAFVFSEAHLYTLEAFETYFDHLKPDGVISVSRLFNSDLPGETLRLEALAMEAWRQRGIAHPADHMAIVTRGTVGTLIMGRSPLTESDQATLRQLAEQMEFNNLWLPDGSVPNSPFANLARADDPREFIANYIFNISPPTDNQPFFFHMLRPGDVIRLVLGLTSDHTDAFFIQANYRAVLVLLALVALVSIFAVAFILAPLVLAKREDLLASKGPWRWRLVFYFACLGVGFMFVEVPMIQRLNLFLGHPIYAFATVLATLLVSGGIGSFTTNRVAPAEARRRLIRVLPVLILLSLVYLFFQPFPLRMGLHWATPLRIAVAVVQLIPIGLLLGMPLPLGVLVASETSPRLVPWLWGVNGAMSVVGSVGALCAGVLFGFTAALGVGVGVYALALVIVLSAK